MDTNSIDVFTQDLYSYVLESIEGSHESCARVQLFNKPSRYFILGTLADITKASNDNDKSKTTVQNNSLSVRFLIKKESRGNFKISPFCSVFFRVYPNYQEQYDFLELIKKNPSQSIDEGNPKFAEIWQQHECSFESLITSAENDSLKLDFSPFIRKIEKDYKRFSMDKGYDKSWMKSRDTYERSLSKHLKKSKLKKIDWRASINILRQSFDEQYDIISISFENETNENKGQETSLFRCNFEIELENLDIEPFKYEFYFENQVKEVKNYFRCLNCQATFDQNIITTKSYGLFEQPKILPRTEFDGIKASFEDLMSSKALSCLNSILNKMESLVDEYKKNPKFSDQLSEYYQRVIHFHQLCIRFKNGIDLLNNKKEVLKGFKLMQETFDLSSDYPGWRLFQIVFIVSIIPDIVDVKADRDIVELIHVNTGGGKSETYFGVIIFQLFWDRIRGKDKGVSGFVKFPLRMLSIQQLNRLAQVIVCAEKIRKDKKIEGTKFSLGYFVGVSDDFPRHTHEAMQKIKNIIKNGKKPRGVLLDKCPFCGGDVIRKILKKEHTIHHQCDNCGETFLLYYTNEEIYRFLPSFIVSTVDKLASIATNRRVKCLLGGKTSQCPNGHGFTPYMDKCDVVFSRSSSCGLIGDSNLTQFEGPSLMIQDEMHLLREGFGTIDSHFESLLNTFNRKFSNKEFKYVTLTATISGVEDQIHNLYGKNVRIFPGEAPLEDRDFFFKIDDTNGKKETQRVLIGLKPNLRDNQYATLITIYHIARYIETVLDDIGQYAIKLGIEPAHLANIIDYYKRILTYHGKKADVHGIKYFLHTVVTSKLENIDVVPKTLTGDNTLDEIKKAISEIETFDENNIHATFATSIVSHGVDINKWNIMIFQGMTRNTSEYIQSLSRVGRKFQGIVFLWYYPNRVRDLSFYQNFDIYHEMLQTRVEHTPLSRWVKLGFMQTFTSIFSAAIINYFSNYFARPLYKVKDVNEIFKDAANIKMLNDFLQDAFYTGLNDTGSDWVKSQIPVETERRLKFLQQYSGSSACMNFFPNALADSGEYYFKTQFGMRGIQPELNLLLSSRYEDFFEKYTKEGTL